MSTEVQPSVQPVADAPITSTDAPATTATNDAKAETFPAPVEGKAAEKDVQEAIPNETNVAKEKDIGKGEVVVESKPINEGVLNLKAPGIK